MALQSTVQRPNSNVILVELNGRLAHGEDLQKLKPQLPSLAGERDIVLILDLSFL